MQKYEKTVDKKKTKKNPNIKVREAEKSSEERAGGKDYCLDCGKPVLETQLGIECEACCFWHHLECEDVSDDVYEFMCDNADNPSIAWYCKKYAASGKRFKEMLIKMNEKQDERVDQLEMYVKKRMDEMVGTMSKQIDELRNAMNKNPEKSKTWSSVVAVEKKVDKIIEAVEKQKGDSDQLQGCVQNAVRMELQEDKEEMEEINKRKNNIIIHGLRESSDADGNTRNLFDEEVVTDLLHELKCDTVSVQEIIRLGKFEADKDKPRPVKLVVSSEQQKEKVLYSTKNLKGRRDKGFDIVFLHQDLTVKQRKKRQALVQQLKARKESGETNLMIIGDKIVERKQRTS